MKRRDFLSTVSSASIAAAIFGQRSAFGSLLQTQASAVKTFHARVKDQFKILAFSDLHTVQGCANDVFTFNVIKALLPKYDPDLIIVTGDLVPDNSLVSSQWVATELGKLGIPWAYAPGNHDVSTSSAQLHTMMTAAANSLHAGTTTNPSWRIEVCNPGETTPVWNLFMIDDSWPTKGLQQYTVDWFKSEATRIGSNPPPAFFFFHIPLLQYQEVWNTGTCVGLRGEAECPELCIPTAFDDLNNAGNGMIKAMFCGHDHMNNYYGVLDGIRLQYVQNTGYNGYGNQRRGGTLITVDTVTGSFETQSVYATTTATEQAELDQIQTTFGQRLRLSQDQLIINSRENLQDFRLYDLQGRLLFAAPTELSNGSIRLNISASQGIAHYRIKGQNFSEKLKM